MKLFSDQYPIKEKKLFLKKVSLGKKELASIIYHDIFDYPLTFLELIKWSVGDKVRLSNPSNLEVAGKNGYLFIKNRKGLILKRLMRKRVSARKITLAKRYAKILSFIPTIRMVAVTGALAMENVDEEADIDLMIITRKGTLWTTRLFTLLLLDVLRIPRRKYGDKDQKDKLCLNIWLDEKDLVWKKRNIFTAHEIAQITPLVDKKGSHQQFILKNSWIKDYWPNAVTIRESKERAKNQRIKGKEILKPIEFLARKFQFWHMRGKITCETVTPTRALFHPIDWSSLVSSKLAPFLD